MRFCEAHWRESPHRAEAQPFTSKNRRKFSSFQQDRHINQLVITRPPTSIQLSLWNSFSILPLTPYVAKNLDFLTLSRNSTFFVAELWIDGCHAHGHNWQRSSYKLLKCQCLREIRSVCEYLLWCFLILLLVSLTKTSAKGRSLKTKYVETLRSALDEYEHVYVLKYDNMRASHFKDVRADWKESR